MSRSRFVGNTAALGVATAGTAVITLVQVKVLASVLAQDAFGLFAALRGLALFLGLLAANGLPAVLIRFLPQHEARGELRRAAILSAFSVGAALVAAAAILWAIDRFDVGVFRAVPDDALTPGLRMAFAATTAAVTVKFVLFGGFNGLRRFGAQTLLETGALAAQVAWIVAVRDRLDVETLFRILAIVNGAVCVVGLPWFAVRLARDAGPLREAGGEAQANARDAETPSTGAARGDAVAQGTGALAREWASYWIGASVLTLVAVAYSDLDRWIMSRMVLLEVLSLFHVAGRVIRLLDRFLAVPVLAFQPEVTRLDALGRREQADAALRVFVRFNAAVAAFVAAGAALWAPEVVRIVSTRAYAAGSMLVTVMAVAVPMAAVTAPLTSVMKARDAIARAVRCDAAWTITYFAVLLVAVPRAGVLGAALAHVAARAAQLASAVVLSAVPVRARDVASSGLRLAAVAAVAFAPVAVVRIVSEATPWTLAWLPAAAWIYRAGLRALGLLRASDCAMVAGVLERRGMRRAARLAARIV